MCVQHDIALFSVIQESVTKTTKTNFKNCQNCGEKIESGKFCSDICETVYNEAPKGAKPLEAAERENKKQKYCKECGKPIPSSLTFCSSACIKEYRAKKQYIDTVKNEESVIDDKFRKACPQSTEILEKQEQKQTEITSRDLDIELVLKALKTKTEIRLLPRRSHTIKGIPIRFDSNTLRVFIDNGQDIESVLLSEIGHFIFPRELYYGKQ